MVDEAARAVDRDVADDARPGGLPRAGEVALGGREPAGDVHLPPDDRRRGVPFVDQEPGNRNPAGVQADADAERGAPEQAHPAEDLLQRDRRAHRGERLLAGPRAAGEGGHEAVAEILVDRAAEALHDQRRGVEDLVELAGEIPLGDGALGGAREAADVGEEDRRRAHPALDGLRRART